MDIQNEELAHENIDYLDADLDQRYVELESVSKEEVIRIQIDEGLEQSIKEFENLKELLSADEGDKLIELCKNTVLETITSQFGIASLFADCKDGGNVTTTHNFEKGKVATEDDKKKYNNFIANNDGSKKWEDVRKDGGYDAPIPRMRKKAFREEQEIVDAYTGRPLPKDGRAHLDHIVSAKEIESNAAAHLHMTPEQRAKIATDKSNLAWTEGSANQSKGDLCMDEWLDRQDNKTGGTKAERFGIDRDKASQKDAQARKYIKKEITVATIKKYTSEVLITGGKDAAKMVAYSALGVIMRDFVNAVFIELKATFTNRGNESLADIFNRFKTRMQEIIKELKEKWKDIIKNSIEGGITAFLSNLLIFVINLFATTLRKLVTMIRAGFVSLVQAVKLIANPPSGMSKEEARYQAIKILTAGLIGAASLGLSAGIEKMLQAIPGLQPLMMFPIPSLGGEVRTVSDILAVTLSALIGGLLTTVVLYLLDSYKKENERTQTQIQLIYSSTSVQNNFHKSTS